MLATQAEDQNDNEMGEITSRVSLPQKLESPSLFVMEKGLNNRSENQQKDQQRAEKITETNAGTMHRNKKRQRKVGIEKNISNLDACSSYIELQRKRQKVTRSVLGQKYSSNQLTRAQKALLPSSLISFEKSSLLTNWMLTRTDKNSSDSLVIDHSCAETQASESNAELRKDNNLDDLASSSSSKRLLLDLPSSSQCLHVSDPIAANREAVYRIVSEDHAGQTHSKRKRKRRFRKFTRNVNSPQVIQSDNYQDWQQPDSSSSIFRSSPCNSCTYLPSEDIPSIRNRIENASPNNVSRFLIALLLAPPTQGWYGVDSTSEVISNCDLQLTLPNNEKHVKIQLLLEFYLSDSNVLRDIYIQSKMGLRHPSKEKDSNSNPHIEKKLNGLVQENTFDQCAASKPTSYHKDTTLAPGSNVKIIPKNQSKQMRREVNYMASTLTNKNYLTSSRYIGGDCIRQMSNEVQNELRSIIYPLKSLDTEVMTSTTVVQSNVETERILWIDASEFLQFNKLKKLHPDLGDILAAASASSVLLVRLIAPSSDLENVHVQDILEHCDQNPAQWHEFYKTAKSMNSDERLTNLRAIVRSYHKSKQMGFQNYQCQWPNGKWQIGRLWPPKGGTKSVQEDISSRTVFFDNLPFHCSPIHLKHIIEQAVGPSVTHISIPRFSVSRVIKGFGFVELKSKDHVQMVTQEFNNQWPQSWPLNVERPRSCFQTSALRSSPCSRQFGKKNSTFQRNEEEVLQLQIPPRVSSDEVNTDSLDTADPSILIRRNRRSLVAVTLDEWRMRKEELKRRDVANGKVPGIADLMSNIVSELRKQPQHGLHLAKPSSSTKLLDQELKAPRVASKSTELDTCFQRRRCWVQLTGIRPPIEPLIIYHFVEHVVTPILVEYDRGSTTAIIQFQSNQEAAWFLFDVKVCRRSLDSQTFFRTLKLHRRCHRAAQSLNAPSHSDGPFFSHCLDLCVLGI